MAVVGVDPRPSHGTMNGEVIDFLSQSGCCATELDLHDGRLEWGVHGDLKIGVNLEKLFLL